MALRQQLLASVTEQINLLMRAYQCHQLQKTSLLYLLYAADCQITRSVTVCSWLTSRCLHCVFLSVSLSLCVCVILRHRYYNWLAWHSV